MGTATLKSILERIVDQMINTTTTANNPAHKNGEERIALRKTTALERSVTGNLASAKAPFLKRNVSLFPVCRWQKVAVIFLVLPSF